MDLDERRALFVYEVCRLEAQYSGRPIVPEKFEERDEGFKSQHIQCIKRICSGDHVMTPREAHDNWMKEYEAMGWKYGPKRDPVAKTHPDMVPYDELPEPERLKDEIFLAVCDLARKYIK